MSTFSLPDDRVEKALPDGKPLLGLAEAHAEAERCLYCADAPCIKACPTEIDVPTFIKKIATGNVRGAAKTILAQNILGYSCARVCPTEVLCEGACVFTGWQHAPIKIGRLQRFALEHATAQGEPPLLRAEPAKGRVRQVALVGAGPASLACAAELVLHGHKATIYERLPIPGGLNAVGIAPYKLHADDALDEVEWLVGFGVEIKTGVEVGRDVEAQDLLARHDAVFLGVGLGKDGKLGISGEDGPGVMGAVQWIERMKIMKKSEARLSLGRVVVVGGGNTALDAARECAQLGAEQVTLVYRRELAKMSGYRHELDAARREGVLVLDETLPHAFVRDAQGKLTGVSVVSTRQGRPVAGSERDLPCDSVCVAIGQAKLRSLVKQFPGVELDELGRVVCDPSTLVTGNPKVFAGGDCTNGGKEVVNAAADGRNAAKAMLGRWSAEEGA